MGWNGQKSRLNVLIWLNVSNAGKSTIFEIKFVPLRNSITKIKRAEELQIEKKCKPLVGIPSKDFD